MERKLYVEKITALKMELEVKLARFVSYRKNHIYKYDSFNDPVVMNERKFIDRIEYEINRREESNFDKKAKKFTRFIDKLIDFDFFDDEDDDESAEQNGFINNIKGHIIKLSNY